MNTHFRIVVMILACCSLGGTGVGCGGDDRSPQSPRGRVVVQQEQPNGPAKFRDGAPASGVPIKEGEAKVADTSIQVRHVIQTSTISLVVKDLEPARQSLMQLIETNEGYISQSEFTGNTGTRRLATWTVRVPAAKFPKFVEAILLLGIPEKHKSDAQDVTDEYVDVQARLKNFKAEEDALNRLMKDLVKTNTDLLAFREQIRQLREKIETSEARFQALTRLTSMSTLHLTLREEADYVPPTTPAAPTFGSRVSDTFTDSFNLLGDFAARIAIFIVAVLVWIPVVAVVVLMIWFFVPRPSYSAAIAAGAAAADRHASTVTREPESTGDRGGEKVEGESNTPS